jgi:hypothetical protein
VAIIGNRAAGFRGVGCYGLGFTVGHCISLENSLNVLGVTRRFTTF